MMKSAAHRVFLITLLTALSVILSACGTAPGTSDTGPGSDFGTGSGISDAGSDPSDAGQSAGSDRGSRRLGTDGYVYVPEAIPHQNPDASYSWITGFRVAGGYLYYSADGIRRIPLEGKLDFTSGEQLQPGGFLTGFTVDQELNLYCCITPKFADPFSSESPDCITLNKYSPDGTLIYHLTFPEERDDNLQSGLHSPIAADSEGNVLLLVENGILKIGKSGSTGKHTFDDSQTDSNIQKYLLQTTDGQIYYVAENYYNATRNVWQVTGEGTPQLTMINALSGDLSSALYEGTDGLLVVAPDGTVSGYFPKNSPAEGTGTSLEEIFCFEDSDLVGQDADGLVQLDQNRFIVSMSNTGQSFSATQELLLMTKTSEDELPEKELLVLASLFPTDDLRRIVIEFNRSSANYHISIESYGAGKRWEDNEGAYTRLDSSLVSGDSPDILDLSGMDISKYAESGAVADLTPYLNQSETVRLQQYLPNLIAGYTIGGKLICLPGSFNVFAVYNLDERCASLKSWTMENVMALTEEYADVRLLPGVWNKSGFMLEDFCSAWYLDQFVDWEKGSCSFDSDGFSRMLEWIKNQLAFGSDDMDTLLGASYLYGFSSYWSKAMELASSPALLGYPSADENPVFRVTANDGLGLAAASGHPEGAWAFLEYYLSREGDSSYAAGFPTQEEQLTALAEDMVTPSYSTDFEGNPIIDQEGNAIPLEKWIGFINGEPVPCYTMEQSHVDIVMDMIHALDFTPQSSLESTVIQIVTEESEYYFNGSKSTEEVTGIIQNRVQLLLQENQ